MTSRSRSPITPSGAGGGPLPGSRAWLVAATLGLGLAPAGASAQDLPALPKPQPTLPLESRDAPLYRDPDPSEGPRIQGPVLSARPPSQLSTPPPPPSNLGPFQGPGPGSPSPGGTGGGGPEPIQQPLLEVPPTLPPLPAPLMAPMLPDDAFGMKRTTFIQKPNGALGRFADWFHDLLRGPTGPPAPTANRRHFFGIPLWPTFAGGGASGSSTIVATGPAPASPAQVPDGSPRWFGRAFFGGPRDRTSD